MVDDRLFRLTIPGTMYLLSLCGWRIADSPQEFLTSLDGLGSTASILGAPTIVIVAGYLIGEIGLALKRPDPDIFLCGDQKIELKNRLEPEGVLDVENLASLTIYTHLHLAKDNQSMANYLTRAWSRIVIAAYCQIAIGSAFFTFCVVRAYQCSYSWCTCLNKFLGCVPGKLIVGALTALLVMLLFNWRSHTSHWLTLRLKRISFCSAFPRYLCPYLFVTILGAIVAVLFGWQIFLYFLLNLAVYKALEGAQRNQNRHRQLCYQSLLGAPQPKKTPDAASTSDDAEAQKD